MSIKKLASEIAKKEGKKTQARIGEVREILKILKALCQDSEYLTILMKYFVSKR